MFLTAMSARFDFDMYRNSTGQVFAWRSAATVLRSVQANPVVKSVDFTDQAKEVGCGLPNDQRLFQLDAQPV